jgi:Leucine-rich repeat (LRR) protein
LQGNNLNGTLSPILFLFTRLQELDVSGNQALSGTIPSEVGILVQLTSLSIADTKLYGTIPSELASIPQLHELTVVGHDDPCSGFHGDIPASLFDNPFLRSVDISLHGLISPLPSEIHRASNLRTLKFFAAGLIGRIPTEIGALSSLKVLELSYNLFDYDATIPSELSSLSDLEFLNVAYSGLNETIPESFCNNANAPRAQLLVATSCQHPLCSCCRNVTSRIATPTGGSMIDIACVQPNDDWMEELTDCTDDWWFDD